MRDITNNISKINAVPRDRWPQLGVLVEPTDFGAKQFEPAVPIRDTKLPPRSVLVRIQVNAFQVRHKLFAQTHSLPLLVVFAQLGDDVGFACVGRNLDASVGGNVFQLRDGFAFVAVGPAVVRPFRPDSCITSRDALL